MAAVNAAVEAVPGRRARQHAVSAPRHVQAHCAPGERHCTRDEPRRRARAGRAVTRAVQHHEVTTGELLDRFGAGQPGRQRDHAPHRRVTGRAQRRPSTHGVTDEDDGHAVVARIERGEGEGDVGQGVVAGVVPAPDPVPELCRPRGRRRARRGRGRRAACGAPPADPRRPGRGSWPCRRGGRGPRPAAAWRARGSRGTARARPCHPPSRAVSTGPRCGTSPARPRSHDPGIGASSGCTPGVRRGTASGWPARADSRLPRLDSAGVQCCADARGAGQP